MVSGISKVELSVITRAEAVAITETLSDNNITKTESNYCFISHCFEELEFSLG